jgi:hypothetical protein
MEAKAISLNDLALLDVDVDQLLNKSAKTRSLSDEMRRSLVTRGRTAYAESLSSVDTDSLHSFSSHATSKSSRSNASSSISSVNSHASSTASRTPNSKKGKILARMSLTGVEAMAMAETRKREAANIKKDREKNYATLKKQQLLNEKKQKRLLRNSFFNSIDDDADNDNNTKRNLSPITTAKSSQQPSNDSDIHKTKYPQLNANDVLKIVDILGPNLKKTSSIRTLLDSYTLGTQHYISRNIRRVKHIIEKQSLLGKRKLKPQKNASSPQHVCVKLSEWINKHVFYPRSIHLNDGGDKLFLIVFRLAMAEKIKKINHLRKIGWEKYRMKIVNDEASLSPSIVKLLDGIQKKEEKDKMLHEIKKIVGKKNKYSKERLKHKTDLTHYANKKQNKTSPNASSKTTTPPRTAVDDINKYVDETGEKTSARWEKFIDHDGTALFANELTGEVLPEKELRNHFFNTSKESRRLQKKKQLIDGETLLSSILPNGAAVGDYDDDRVFSDIDKRKNNNYPNDNISIDSNNNSFNIIHINDEGDERHSGSSTKKDKPNRSTPTKSYFSLKGMRKIAKRIIKGPSAKQKSTQLVNGGANKYTLNDTDGYRNSLDVDGIV